ncbi:hypothetical protein [Candidatus Ichthyocystis sparus]|uniref:hypothetical protein n=1 Tax=Candidatus Ichthyocystis sparus TaxID=1561004 RepID=UPI000B825926|nr:hypothetical protein [Candidatus Ichthyocystis sparus]
MSDKRIYGASGDSSSEADEPAAGGGEYPLGAVGQDNKGGKSEGKDGSRRSSVPLTNPSGSGSQGLGAKPKVKQRGNKERPGKRGDDIWNNPTRKSARSLRGRGQALAAARGYGHDYDTEDDRPSTSEAVSRLGKGPRCKFGPGKAEALRPKHHQGDDDSTDYLCTFVTLAVAFSSIAVFFFFDFLESWTSGSEYNSRTGLRGSFSLSATVGLCMALILIFISICAILSGTRRSKKS